MKKQFLSRFPKDMNRLDWATRLVSLAFLIQIALSWKLWLPYDRMFPLLPVFENLSFNPGWPFSLGLFSILIMSLCSLMFLGLRKKVLLFQLLILIVLILQDALRIQAWVYQYLLTYIVLYLISRQTDKYETQGIQALQLITILTYSWSGLHKFNPHFTTDVFPWLMGCYEFSSSFGSSTITAYLLAGFEVLLGVVLFIPRTRNTGVVLVACFHLGILTFLVADFWNTVVYPWNLLMIALSITLFYQNKNPIALRLKWSLEKTIIIALLGVMPFFQLFRLWDGNLSCTMYTGTSLTGILVIQEEGRQCFPKSLLSSLTSSVKYNGEYLYLDDWTMEELNVPMYDSRQKLLQAQRAICPCLTGENSGLEIETVKRWTTKDKHIEFAGCSN